MLKTWTPQNATTRRTISAITAALLALTLVVILPAASGIDRADAAPAFTVAKTPTPSDITEDTDVVFSVLITNTSAEAMTLTSITDKIKSKGSVKVNDGKEFDVTGGVGVLPGDEPVTSPVLSTTCGTDFVVSIAGSGGTYSCSFTLSVLLVHAEKGEVEDELKVKAVETGDTDQKLEETTKAVVTTPDGGGGGVAGSTCAAQVTDPGNEIDWYVVFQHRDGSTSTRAGSSATGNGVAIKNAGGVNHLVDYDEVTDENPGNCEWVEIHLSCSDVFNLGDDEYGDYTSSSPWGYTSKGEWPLAPTETLGVDNVDNDWDWRVLYLYSVNDNKGECGYNNIQRPGINVTKTTDTPSVESPGAYVTYDVAIENLNPWDAVTIDTLTDEVEEDGSPYDIVGLNSDADANTSTTCGPLDINIAAGATYTCEFTVWVGDSVDIVDDDPLLLADNVVDEVCASGTSDYPGDLELNDKGLGFVLTPANYEVSGCDDEEVDITEPRIQEQPPSITLVKEVLTPADLTVDAAGQNVTYRVTIGNSSTTEAVTIDSLSDDVDGKIYDLLDLNEVPDIVDNTCNDDLPMTIAASGSENCTFTLWVDHETVSAAGTHDSCTPDDQLIDIATAKGTGITTELDTNEPSACAEVTIDEPDASLAINKLVWDEGLNKYADDAYLPSSTTFITTVTWQITVSNPSVVDTVINVSLGDTNAPACVTAFATAMDAVEISKDWLDPEEEVTFTCDGDVPSVPYVNTAVANGDDVWDRPVDEVSDIARVFQIQAAGVIGDTVWYDCAKSDATDPTCDNGTQDVDEPGIEGAKVTITGLDGQDVDANTSGVQTSLTKLTDSDGRYLFSGLPDGNYKVQVLIDDVPDAESRTLRFTTASSFTILLPEGGQRLDADFGVIADTLPQTGISTDQILMVAILLIIAGSFAVLVSKRRDDIYGSDVAA